jgi:hypothetical protein
MVSSSEAVFIGGYGERWQVWCLVRNVVGVETAAPSCPDVRCR